MTNVRPLRGYVYIELLPQEQTSASGLTLPDLEKQRQAKGKVLSVGELPFEVIKIKESLVPEIMEGEKVIFKRFAGEVWKEGGKEYALIPYNEILGVYET